jgi:hypothetical protein
VKTIRIGCGAGYSGDRIDPAVELAERGDLDYLIFECLAERTIALAHLDRMRDASRGFDPRLEERMMAVLPACLRRGTRILTNMGAANPSGAARAVCECARRLGLRSIRVAIVGGDDVTEWLRANRPLVRDQDPAMDREAFFTAVVSANAYLGADAIISALETGADVIVTGRVADPSLFLAPLVGQFGWGLDDWPVLGQATVVGHLLECAGQVSGGYFADPGRKDVEGLARLGFPLAEVNADGTAVITKVPGSGGRVTVATCKEQLLYEVHDPAGYVTPDVVADFSSVTFAGDGEDRVVVGGGSGRQRPDALKVSIGYRDGFIGEGQISYAGPGALLRAKLAADVVRERLSVLHGLTNLRCDILGVDALLGKRASQSRSEPYEVRLRVAGRASSAPDAARVGDEVEALYTNGPAGGGGAFKSVREVLAVASAFMPRSDVTPTAWLEQS